MGGTAGVAHGWEPDGRLVDFEKYYTSYALGYSVVDAAYLGMNSLAWQNVVVGDPLTTIAWGKQTLTQNLTWQGTNLVTDTINIPLVKTLTIPSGAIINLRHHGFITGDGDLIVDKMLRLMYQIGSTPYSLQKKIIIPSWFGAIILIFRQQMDLTYTGKWMTAVGF